VDELLSDLARCRPGLARRVREALPDAAAAARPLIEAVERDLAEPCGDDAVVAAIRLLGAWRVEAAVGPLIALLESADSLEHVWSAAIFALGEIGLPAVEPLLAAHGRRRDDDDGAGIANALSETGVRDERIFELLLATLRESRALGAILLAEYGDARALPALSTALDGFEVDPKSPIANIDGFDLEDAVVTLGGELSPTQRAKLDHARAISQAFRQMFEGIEERLVPARRAERPGRNDPCHCGSGRKYKKCHLESDRAGRVEVRAE